MKFFLASTNITAALQPCFGELVGKDFADIRFALIENAADPYEESEKGFVYETRAAFEALGMQIRRVDLRDYGVGGKSLDEELQKFDVIWLGGGNVFYLAWILKESGFDVLVRKILESGVVYGGGSAGAIIAGPVLGKFDLVDDRAKSPEPESQALGLTDLIVIPHWGYEKFQEKLQEIKNYHDKNAGRVVVTIGDHQAVVIDENGWDICP